METLSANELNIIINLMDIATKAGGLQVAQQSLPLALKIQNMVQSETANPIETQSTETETF